MMQIYSISHIHIKTQYYITAVRGASADSDAAGRRDDRRVRQRVGTPGGGRALGCGGRGLRLYLDMVHTGMGHRGRWCSLFTIA